MEGALPSSCPPPLRGRSAAHKHEKVGRVGGPRVGAGTADAATSLKTEASGRS